MKNPPVWPNIAAFFRYGRYTLPMKMIRTLLLATLAGVSFAASAQWLWIDKDGHKVFSDRSPPPDILEKNILKRPGGPKPVVTPVADAPDADPSQVAAPPAAPASGAKTGGVDKDLEAKKKLADDADAAKRKAAEEQRTKAKVESCARAKVAKASLDSGARMGHTNAAGEREFMDETARAQEAKRIQGIINNDCK